MAVSTRPEARASVAPLRRGGFSRIVVPIDPAAGVPARAVEAAARVAADGATVLVAAVIEVPRELPLDAFLTEEEGEARGVLRNAASVAERYGVHTLQRLERAHSSASAVLALADDFGADLIVLDAPRRTRRGRSAFAPTTRLLLQRAGCRVLLIAQPR